MTRSEGSHAGDWFRVLDPCNDSGSSAGGDAFTDGVVPHVEASDRIRSGSRMPGPFRAVRRPAVRREYLKDKDGNPVLNEDGKNKY
ncbi:hypothetical protein, partial [Propionibacterium acidifaciens]|uniref:hypothetical protein n=1 Tax=Propionibacterium acidifaciens TaxID=556499 RepID=UPI00362376A8